MSSIVLNCFQFFLDCTEFTHGIHEFRMFFLYVFVLFAGHEVHVCKEDCQGADSAGPHYHCPMCSALYCDRKLIISHLWRCEVSSKEGKSSEGNKNRGKDIKHITEQLEKAYSITSDLPPATENEEIVVRFKI